MCAHSQCQHRLTRRPAAAAVAARYTWTLSIQFHFYLVLPLVWNYFGAKGLVRACKWLLVVVVALRAFAPYHMKDVLPMSDELGFFSFFWYALPFTPSYSASGTCTRANTGNTMTGHSLRAPTSMLAFVALC